MKISAIKNAVEHYSISELSEAEEALTNESDLPIEIEGEDEGEQLTHIMAAIWVKQYLKENQDKDVKQAIREYSVKVRNSIS